MACSRNHDLPSLSIACSPARNYEGDIFGLRPFGASSAKNTLEHFLGTPDIVNHVCVDYFCSIIITKILIKCMFCFILILLGFVFRLW